MSGALARHLPHCKAWSSIGGTAYWIEGPPQLDARETGRRAALAGILIEPGDIHFLSPAPPRYTFRLGFSSIPLDRIEPGLQRLGDIISTQLKEIGAGPGRPPSAVI
jgi:GntR family transcriptional regulator/MocR family aminotransferase